MEHDLLQGKSKELKRNFRLSIAIPVHNEETVITELLERTLSILNQISGGPHELLLVDDGCTDGTLPILETAAKLDSRINVISLSRNFGHQAALTAALDHVIGDAVVVMDGDLQDAPEDIPRFVELFSRGFDIVYAQRIRRKEKWVLRLCYFLFYRMMSWLSEIHLPLDSGDFGLLSRRVVDQLRRMPEHHRYLRGMRIWVGFRQIGIPLERLVRHSGRSKYGFMRLLKLAADGIFAFSIVPIRAAALLGAATVLIAGLFAIYAIISKIFFHKSPQGFTALLLLTTFMSGVLLFFLGVIGEYIGRIYEESKNRPLYIIGRVIGENLKTHTDSNFQGHQR
jgi:glycosyltransferase involved in cell wall biosynthesis